MANLRQRLRRKVFAGGLFLTVCLLFLVPGRSDEPLFQVKIEDGETSFVERSLPVDPMPHITLRWGAPMSFTPYVDNKRLVFSSSGGIRNTLKIDGRVLQVGSAPGRVVVNRAPLPPRAGKSRQGWKTVYVIDNIHVTQTVEIVPTRPSDKAKSGDKRRLDAVLSRYQIENKDSQPHSVGFRLAMDMLLVNNDGCLFAAPTLPGKILNGVELKDKTMPKYLQVLQRPDLKNPGFVAHYTFDLGRKFEKPTRVVLTRHALEYAQWDVQAQPANGDSGMAIFWDPREIRPGSHVELAYAYGQGLASNPENEGRVSIALGGSFQPGKLFEIAAYVYDPFPGQFLKLDLPPGMERVEGKRLQPVTPPLRDGEGLVLWKARVLRPGQYTLRVHSSNGATRSKIVTITPSQGAAAKDS